MYILLYMYLLVCKHEFIIKHIYSYQNMLYLLQALYWHAFGSLLTIGIIIYFAIPAAIASSSFSKERNNGVLDILSTLPNVHIFHSILAWLCCEIFWVLTSFFGTIK